MTAALLALVGPTGAGKTALALELARRTPIEVVSLDSVQLYRGFDIGSAKATGAERATLPHHLVDVAEPDERWSAARWLTAAERAILDVRARGNVPLVCGGTGLYLRALTTGLAELPAADDALRARLLDEERATPGSLHARLRTLDPTTASRLAPRDLVRVIRAIEVQTATGRPLSEHHETHAASRAAHAPTVLFLDPPLPLHDAALRRRSDEMLRAGLVDEARTLRARWGAVQPLEAVGYKEAIAALDGHLPETELAARITLASRQFARRQRTWFKKAPGVQRFEHPAELLEAALRLL